MHHRTVIIEFCYKLYDEVLDFVIATMHSCHGNDWLWNAHCVLIRFSLYQYRLADFAKLYDVIKNERNKCVNLIQTSTQVSREYRSFCRWKFCSWFVSFVLLSSHFSISMTQNPSLVMISQNLPRWPEQAAHSWNSPNRSPPPPPPERIFISLFFNIKIQNASWFVIAVRGWICYNI